MTPKVALVCYRNISAHFLWFAAEAVIEAGEKKKSSELVEVLQFLHCYNYASKMGTLHAFSRLYRVRW